MATVSSDDPILSSALAELTAEGALDTSAPVTEPTDSETGTSTVPVGADPTTSPPDAATVETPAVESDPLQGSEPLTYLVDGQPLTFDGAYVIPGEGAVIPASALPKLQSELANARVYQARAEALERSTDEIQRLAEWQTQDEQGQAVTLTGRAAIEAQRVTHGRTLATLSTISKVFEQDPSSLLSVNEAGAIVWNRDALEMLSTRAENAAIRTEQAIRSKFGAMGSHGAQAPGASTEPSAEQFTATVRQAAQSSGVAGLTPDDVTYLASQLPNYVRTATVNDRALGFQPGQKFVDARFVDVMKYTAQLRAEKMKAATAAESAGKFNAGQQRGRQAASAPATPTKTPVASSSTKPPGREAQWTSVLDGALAEMGIGPN